MRALVALSLVCLLASCQKASSDVALAATTSTNPAIGQLVTRGQFVEIVIDGKVAGKIDPLAVTTVPFYSKPGPMSMADKQPDQMRIYLYPGFPTIPANQPFEIRIPDGGNKTTDLVMWRNGQNIHESGSTYGGFSFSTTPSGKMFNDMAAMVQHGFNVAGVSKGVTDKLGGYVVTPGNYQEKAYGMTYAEEEAGKVTVFRFPQGIPKPGLYAIPASYLYIVTVVIQ